MIIPCYTPMKTANMLETALMATYPEMTVMADPMA